MEDHALPRATAVKHVGEWPGAGFGARRDLDHAQNRKYRCAIGSTVAGSQVSSTPSARTS